MCRILDVNPRIQWFHTEKAYSHPDAIFSLTDRPHKLLNAAAIWLDDVLYDADFCCPALHDACKFIYIVRDPAQPLAQLMASGKKSASAFRYYIFRLRRICQMAAKTPGAVLLTWDDMITRAGFPLVEKYLKLKEELVLRTDWFPEPLDISRVPGDLLERAERSYNQHLYHLRQLQDLPQVKRGPLSALGGEDDLIGEEVPSGKTSITD
jgi:hypothetical protein